ncbi:MAG: thiolase family protein [Firmicutes bacterium]|nr:thiolase family protein [Bacillota bacterium]
MYSKAFIPYGAYYSSPFARWQGSLQNEHAIELAAATAKKWLETKSIDPKIFDYLYLGKTVGQKNTFYSAPWAAGLIGATDIPGLHVPQACSTSTTCLGLAATNIEAGIFENAFCLMADRCSNGPHTVWPNPMGPGGEVISENWNLDNMNKDPYAGKPMYMTAENVARKSGWITKEDCDEITLRRYEQYMDALADDRAFQKRYMFPVEYKKTKKKTALLEADEGVTSTTKEGMAKLKPIIDGGVHTFASQTHPADGNCGIIVCTKEKASEFSSDNSIEIQAVSYGFARTEKAHMPAAPLPAAKMALERAGISIDDIKALKTHNPFATNDLFLAREINYDVLKINNYGSSLIYGHPQGPTTGRGIIELIEELVILGGGYGLLTGCAAGDTGAALVVRVS